MELLLTTLTVSPAPPVLPKLLPLDSRVPRWGHEDLVPRSCPVCGARNLQVLRRPDGLPVAYCAICALWYVSSRPRPERLESFYQDYWGAFRPARRDAWTARFMLWAARGNARADLRVNRLAAILGTLHGKRVVDVGCGMGGFLLSMQALGAQPLGVEISREAREFARQHLGLPVYADLSQCLAQTGPVDAIVLNDLVEHLADPVELLGSAAAALRPGGVLAIWTPNGGAAGASLASASEWVGFRVDLEHLQYFSPRTILLLAGKLGLTVEHIETTGFPRLAGIGRESKLPSWIRTRLKEAGIAVSLSSVGPAAKALWRSLTPRSDTQERTTGTYHLFAVLKNG
jgi:2-polyprenyl-3-methyl-5-hydroxy-6-metoxy-1,4-benzoquinol methylase